MKNRPTRTVFQSRIDHMINTIRNEVKEGILVSGDYLPAEHELAEHYQMSKNSVRKALDIMVKEGLIEKIPRVGNRIKVNLDREVTVIRFVCHNNLLLDACLPELIQRFHDQYPHIQVQMIPLSDDYYAETIMTYMEHGLCDVLTVNYDQHQMLAMEDRHSSLVEMEEDKDQYSFLQAGFKVHERLFFQPLVFSPVVLGYNRLHFIEEQVPEPDHSWTWNSLKAAAAQLAGKQNRYGFYFQLASPNRWSIFLLQNEYKLDERDRHHNSSIFVDSMKYCSDLLFDQEVVPVYISENNQDAESLMIKGHASMIMTTYFNLNHFLDCSIPFDLAPLPHNHQPGTLLLAIGLGIIRSTPVRPEAQLFVDYLTSYESQLLIRQQTYSIPAHKRAAEWNGQEQIYRPSRFHLYKDIISSYRSVEELGFTPAQLSQLKKELTLFWAGMTNESQLREILESMITYDGRKNRE